MSDDDRANDSDDDRSDGVYWAAPTSSGPVHATVVLPGSKSQTARALVIGTIAAAPTEIHGALASRDTYLGAHAMIEFGAKIRADEDDSLVVRPAARLRAGRTINCGQAGTVMRFASALGAFTDGKTTITCDPSARTRPIGPLMDSLCQLGARIKYRGATGHLPATITGLASAARRQRQAPMGEPQILVDTTSSSQYLSALLATSPLMERPTLIRAQGQVPSWPYVAMTLEMLADQGVDVKRIDGWSWRSDPTRPAGNPIQIEPDLANAGPFLAAALLAGGSVTIRDWPAVTDQVGKYWLELLPQFGAQLTLTLDGLTVTAPPGLRWPGLELDMGAYGELAPTLAALALFATSPSTFTGIGHLRGHETDRLEALTTEIERLGGHAKVLRDGIHIVPRPLHAAALRSYEDHRMATFGAIVGLRVPGCWVENIATTAKTLPLFTARWKAMLEHAPSPRPLTMGTVLENPQVLLSQTP